MEGKQNDEEDIMEKTVMLTRSRRIKWKHLVEDEGEKCEEEKDEDK